MFDGRPRRQAISVVGARVGCPGLFLTARSGSSCSRRGAQRNRRAGVVAETGDAAVHCVAAVDPEERVRGPRGPIRLRKEQRRASDDRADAFGAARLALPSEQHASNSDHGIIVAFARLCLGVVLQG